MICVYVCLLLVLPNRDWTRMQSKIEDTFDSLEHYIRSMQSFVREQVCVSVHVCLSVCLSVCVCACVCVCAGLSLLNQRCDVTTGHA